MKEIIRKIGSLLLAGAMTFSAMGIQVQAMNASGGTDLADTMVFVEASDVEVTSSSINGEMKSVITVYDENKKNINLGKFEQNINTITVSGASEGYPYKYVGYADYSSMYSCAIYVEYEKDENGKAIKDDDGNYVISALKDVFGKPVKSDNKETTDLNAYFDSLNSGPYGMIYFLKDSKGNIASTYCVGMGIEAVKDSYYSVANLSEGNYYASEDAEDHVRAIALNGYWGTEGTYDEATGQYATGSLAKLKADLKQAIKDGTVETTYNITYKKDTNEVTSKEITVTEAMVDELLTEGIALEMTQSAIWSWSNGAQAVQDGKDGYIVADVILTQKKKPENSAIRKLLYNYLLNLEPQEAQTVVIDEKNFIEDLKLIVSEDNNKEDNIYDVNLQFTLAATPSDKDDLVLTIGYGEETIAVRLAGQNGEDENYTTLTPDSNGVYTISGLSLEENKPFNITMQIVGEQYLVHDAYMYLAEGGFDASQTMVGIAEGTHIVDVSMSADVTFDLRDYEERKITFNKITTVNDQHYPLAGIEFDIYKVCTLEEYTENYTDYVETRVMTDGSDKDFVSSEVLDNLDDYPLVETVVTDINGNGVYDLTEDGQPDGIYLVIEKEHPAITTPLLPFYVTVPQTSMDGSTKEYIIDLRPKNVLLPGPEIDKDVTEIDQEEDSVNAGEEFTWIIRGSIPADMAIAKEYVITDELDYRLTYAGDLVVKVEKSDDKADNSVLGNDVLVEGKDYNLVVEDDTVTPEGGTEEKIQRITVSLTQDGMKKVAKIAGVNRAQNEVRVYFNTIIDDDATMGEAIANDAGLKYINSVGFEFEVESEDPVVYTCGINIYKYDAKNKATALSGAVFKLARVATDEEVAAELSAPLVTEDDGVVNVVYEEFYNNAELSGDKVSKVTTVSSGAAVIYGLEEDEYYLVEIQAPEGYNLLSYPVKVTLDESSHLDDNKVEVANSNQFKLPETGGMGTTIFTASGMMMLAAAAFVLMKKKENEEA